MYSSLFVVTTNSFSTNNIGYFCKMRKYNSFRWQINKFHFDICSMRTFFGTSFLCFHRHSHFWPHYIQLRKKVCMWCKILFENGKYKISVTCLPYLPFFFVSIFKIRLNVITLTGLRTVCQVHIEHQAPSIEILVFLLFQKMKAEITYISTTWSVSMSARILGILVDVLFVVLFNISF